MRLHSLSGCQEVRHHISLNCAPTSSLICSLHPWKAWKDQSLFISLSPQWLCLFQFTISQNTSWPFYARAIPYPPLSGLKCFLCGLHTLDLADTHFQIRSGIVG